MHSSFRVTNLRAGIIFFSDSQFLFPDPQGGVSVLLVRQFIASPEQAG